MNLKTATALIALLCAIDVVGAASWQADTTPIVEDINPIESLSYEELRDIFTLTTTRWPNGSKVVVVMLSSDNILQRHFLFEYFGLNPTRYNEIVSRKILTGRVHPLIIVNTEWEMIRTVSKTVGSIGFTTNNVFIGKADGVKVLPIY
jgi:hypothetical protein